MKNKVKYIIIGVLLFVIGAFVMPLGLVLYFVTLEETATKFKIPCYREITVEEPGKYYLWNEYQCVFEGTVYNSSEVLPNGLKINLISKDTSKTPELHSDASMSVSSGNNESNSVGYYNITETGIYFLEVSGDADTRIFSFGKSRIGKIIIVVLIFGILSLVISFTGIGVTIYGIVQVVKGNRVSRE